MLRLSIKVDYIKAGMCSGELIVPLSPNGHPGIQAAVFRLPKCRVAKQNKKNIRLA